MARPVSEAEKARRERFATQGANALKEYHASGERERIWWQGGDEEAVYSLALAQMQAYLSNPNTDKSTRLKLITLAVRLKVASKDPKAKAALMGLLEGLGGEDEQADEVPADAVDQDEVAGGGEPRAELGPEGSDRGGREGRAGETAG